MTPGSYTSFSPELRAVLELAERIEQEAASNPERVVQEDTRHQLWNALVALRESEK